MNEQEKGHPIIEIKNPAKAWCPEKDHEPVIDRLRGINIRCRGQIRYDFKNVARCCNCYHFRIYKEDDLEKRICEVGGTITCINNDEVGECEDFEFNETRFRFEELTNMPEKKRRIKREL